MSDSQWDPGLCAHDYKYRVDIDFDEHRIALRPLEKALMQLCCKFSNVSLRMELKEPLS